MILSEDVAKWYQETYTDSNVASETACKENVKKRAGVSLFSRGLSSTKLSSQKDNKEKHQHIGLGGLPK